MVKVKQMTKRSGWTTFGTSITTLFGLMVLATRTTVQAKKLASRTGYSLKGSSNERRTLGSRALHIKGKGGKGGSGGSSSGNNIPSEAWVDGEYYGCLGLSEDQLSNVRSSGLTCDYVVHNASIPSTESSGNQAASGEASGGDGTSGGTSDSTMSSQNAEASTEAGGDDSTLANYDGQDAAANGQSGNKAANYGNNGGNAYHWYSQQQSKQKSQAKQQVTVTQISEEYDSPYDAFNIKACDTYEHLWTWDLEISCGNTTDYHECHCTFAEVLMEKGQLTCDAYRTCPSGCSICSNCLKLLGCADDVDTISYSGSAAATAAAIISLLFGTGCCMIVGKRNGRRGKLNDHLMDDENLDAQGKIWMVPVTAGVPHENGTSMYPVWLAPDTDSVSSGAFTGSLSSSSSFADTAQGEVIDLTRITSFEDTKRHGVPSFPRNTFPDVLAPSSVHVDQHLPARGVPRSRTDLTGRSDSSDEGDDDIRIVHSAPNSHRQPRREVEAEAGEEEFDFSNGYNTGSSSISYYSSRREALDLPSLTGLPSRA